MAYVFHGNGPWGTGKNALLTPVEVDNNFWQAIQDISAKAVQGVGISNIVQSGNQLTFVMTDHTLIGPFTLPAIAVTFAGEWLPDFMYVAGAVITHGGSTYMVLINHTSEATFDPGANDGFGHDFYGLLLENPALTIPVGGAVGTFLRKLTTVDFVTAWQTAALTDLTDVSLPTSPGPVTGDVLTFSGSLWTASQTAKALSELSDVLILDSPSLETGQLLMWDGAVWTNSNIAGFTPTVVAPISGELLVYDASSSTWKNKNTADLPVAPAVGVFGTITLDYSLGAVQRLTMSGGTTLDHVTNWPPAGQFGRLVLEIINPGASTWTWPAGYHWPGGSAPTVSVSGRDIFALTTFDGGTHVDGSVIGQNYL